MEPIVAPKTELLKRIKAYAENYLTSKIPSELYYHNLEHTRVVVDAAKEIGRACNLSSEEMETVQLAAWLHDTGYSKCNAGHEAESVEITKDVLAKNGASEDKIEQVVNCVQATAYPQNPTNLVEKVMCDADMIHLALPDYFEKSELLRQELSHLKGYEIEKREWTLGNMKFFRHHQYFTEYGKSVLEELKNKNRKKLKKAIKQQENSINVMEDLEIEKKGKEKKKKKKDKKGDKPERGIETMFRTTSHNHLELSSIADNKANIMISINAIIISILVSVLFRKFEEFPNLVAPTILLTVVCLFTTVFAILATRPNVTEGKFHKEDILSKKKTNLLFFGNFYNMSLEDYEWGIKEIMKDSDYLYSNMIRDIYFLGKVLGRKYKLLRISYTIFMFGFVISILAFGISILFFQPRLP
jgi:predicted metal-dependent HD superfamily phosphohydrolase